MRATGLCVAIAAALTLSAASMAGEPAGQNGGVQRGVPYEVLAAPDDAASYFARLGGAPSGVWLEGDVLHMAHVSPEGPVQVTGGLQLPLERVGSSDLWLVRLRWDCWADAFVSYTFIGPGGPGRPAFDVWRGAEAPELPTRDGTLARVEQIEMKSEALGETRHMTVALPPGEHAELAAIVMADGQAAASWASVLFPLMERGAMRPAAIVGIHSVHYRGEPGAAYDPTLDIRAREYIESNDPERFERHLRWVTDEALPLVAERFGVSLRREDLVVAGYSNGGSFAAAAGLRRPDVFGGVLALSVGVSPEGERPEGELPRIRAAAGALEPAFLRASSHVVDVVRGWGGDATLRTYQAGHDFLMWEMAAAALAPELLPPD